MNKPFTLSPRIRQSFASLAIASAIVSAPGCGGTGGGDSSAVLREVIVFTRGGTLYRTETDGTGLQTINNLGARHATASPDGTRILCVVGDQVTTVSPTGKNPQTLTSGPALNWHPMFSPDGSKIAFTSNRDGGDWELYVMNANGSNEVRITNRNGEDSMPCWSPDGSKIYYMYSDAADIKIWRMDPDGTDAEAVSTGTGYDAYPVVNPAGTKIVFARNIGVNQQVYTMDIDGGNIAELPNASGADAEFAPRWSADGSKIVYFWRASGTSGDRIHVCDADGANDHELLPGTGPNDEFPAFATLLLAP